MPDRLPVASEAESLLRPPVVKVRLLDSFICHLPGEGPPQPGVIPEELLLQSGIALQRHCAPARMPMTIPSGRWSGTVEYSALDQNLSSLALSVVALQLKLVENKNSSGVLLSSISDYPKTNNI